MRVARVAGNEDARRAQAGLVRGDIVETVGDALADLVHREPRDVSHIERVGAQHPLSGRDDHLLRVLAEGLALVRVDLTQVDVEPNHVAAFARDEQDVSLVGRLNRGLEPDVGKVGDGQHVHDTPGMVREVAARHCPDRIAHPAACPVPADDILGRTADSEPLATVRSLATTG